MSGELDDALDMADKEGMSLARKPVNSNPIAQTMQVFGRALVVLAREVRRLEMYKILFLAMKEATTCDCTGWADCHHLANAFAVFEATESEMKKIEENKRLLAGRPKTIREILETKPKKVDIMAPGITSVMNPDIIQ